MKVRNTALPRSRVEVDTIGGITTISLWDGEYTGHGVADETGNRVEYEYTLYQIQTQNRPGLAAAVERNFEKWFFVAKQKEEEKQTIEEAMDAEREFEEALPDILLDLDFRLMMKEVFPD